MAGKNNKIKKDQQVVVLEDINSKLALVLEQFFGLNKRIDGNHKEFLGFKGETGEFRGVMIGFKNEMTSFRKQTDENFKEIFRFMDRTDKNLKVALEYLFRIDEEIQDMKAELKDLKKLLTGKADLEKLMSFEKRLLKLEKLVFAKLN